MKSSATFAALIFVGLLVLCAEARPDPEADKTADSTTADGDHIIFGGGISGQSTDGKADENLMPFVPSASVEEADVAANGPSAEINLNWHATSEDKANAQNSLAADCSGTEANAPCAENLWFGSTTSEDNDIPMTSEDKADAQNSIDTDCFGTEANAPCADNLGLASATAEDTADAQNSIDTDCFGTEANAPCADNLGLASATAEDTADAQNSIDTDCSGAEANAPCAENLWFGSTTSEDEADAQNSIATDCSGTEANAPCADNLWFGSATAEDKADAQNSLAADCSGTEANAPCAENLWFGSTTAAENNLNPLASEEKIAVKNFNFGELGVNADPPCAETGDCRPYAPRFTHMRPVYTRCGDFGVTHGACEALECAWLPSPIGDCWAVKYEY